MTGDTHFQTVLEKQAQIKDEALKLTQWKNTRSIHDKKARFPPFKQGTTLLKAGTQIQLGGLRLPIDITMHESVATTLSDGTTLYSDIFLPGRHSNPIAPTDRPVPALIAWSPYGKQKGSTLLDDIPLRAGVPREWLSGLQKWEGPDPAFWCAHEYAIVNVDIRGAFSAEGDLHFFGQQEAQDGAEFITWVSKQPWCNGKVALTGNSWLAIAQWRIGSLCPEGLAALAPWEGFSDIYRHNICEGGVPFWGFHNLVADALVSQGKLEDPAAVLKSDDLRNSYWEDKTADPGLITAPIYVVASWTNAAHTLGTLKSWAALRESTPKWLRVHNKQEWSDYYDDDAQKDLKRFFDFYLHGRTDNGWDATPRVRLSILHLGLGSLTDTVNRPENEFPLARTHYVRHYLTADGGLSLTAPSDTTTTSYDSKNGRAVFRYRVPRSCETTGYFMAHLVVSCDAPGMDVFVQIEKLSPANRRQGTLVIKPQSALIRGAIKTIHDWQFGLDKAGPLLHWGPHGVLRGSHSVSYDAGRSTPSQPFYTHDTKKPFEKGEIRVLDIQIRPYGMYWEKDDILQFTVAGKSVLPFPFPVELQRTENSGRHNIHVGGRGEETSYLLLPFV